MDERRIEGSLRLRGGAQIRAGHFCEFRMASGLGTSVELVESMSGRYRRLDGRNLWLWIVKVHDRNLHVLRMKETMHVDLFLDVHCI